MFLGRTDNGVFFLQDTDREVAKAFLDGTDVTYWLITDGDPPGLELATEKPGNRRQGRPREFVDVEAGGQVVVAFEFDV